MDRFSPVAPAAVRIMCLPVGSIGSIAFKTVVDRLQIACSIVKLEQLELPPDQEVLLSPKVNPEGSLFLSYTTSATSEHEQQLSPYELFREPLVVLGIATGISDDVAEGPAQLKQAAQYLRERHPRVVHRHLLLLQTSQDGLEAGDNVTRISCDQPGEDEFKDAICKVAARFLVEFSTYAKALQASPNVQTPGQTAKAVRKAMWLIGDDRRPASGSGTATPTNDTGLSSPVAEGSPRPLPRNLQSSPPRQSVGSPPPSTSFDEIQRTALTRSDSNASRGSSGRGKRASSQDRTSVHGFGPEISKSKAKDRGKARAGIVTAHIHMMAGQWSDALRMLTDHTNVARKLNDHLWHAKGLEGIVVSMLLLAWAHLSFSVPFICYPGSEGEGHTKHRSKLSVNLGTDLWPADAAYQASVRRLSTSLPDLLKQIVGLYAAAEGHLELPFIVVAEAKIRFCEILSVLFKAKGELNDETLNYLVKRAPSLPPTAITAVAGLTRGSVAGLLGEAQPQHDDEIALIDHIQLLTGVYGVYSTLGMDRKKGSILKDLVTMLTVALNQARKLGAAEAGIHPAASLSMQPSVNDTFAAFHRSGGIDAMVDQIAQVFGIDLMPRRLSDHDHHESAQSFATWRPFGADVLRTELLSYLIALYEATLDPVGVMRLESSFLRSCVPCAALDSKPRPNENVITREEQFRHAANIARTAQVYAIRGIPNITADYWDPFLLRAVDFAVSETSHSLVPREELGSKVKVDDRPPGYPLLYDPNAKRANTASPIKHVLVRNDSTVCVLTLQNPLDISVDIESVHLVTGGGEKMRLTTEDFNPVSLGPRCLQQISLPVSPTVSGEFDIIGARIKIACCREQFFPIISTPWAASADLLVKHQGQWTPAARQASQSGPMPITSTVAVHAVPAMPLLEVEHVSAEQASLMLLDGEHQELDVVVRNVNSACPAVISEVAQNNGLLWLRSSKRQEAGFAGEEEIVVKPGETTKISFDVQGIAGASQTRLDLYYGPSPTRTEDCFARVLRIPLSVTVDATLQVHHARVEDVSETAFALSFDLANCWHKSLHYSTLVRNDQSSGEDGVLAPGKIVRISMTVQRWSRSDDKLEKLSEDIIRRIEILWRTFDDARFGRVNLKSLALSTSQLEVIRGPLHRLTMKVVGEGDEHRVGSFVVVRARLRNDAKKNSGPLIVELHLPSGERHIASIGVLHRILPSVQANSDIEVEFVVCPLLAGSVELRMIAHDVKLLGDDERGESWQTEASLVLDVGEKVGSR
ncbi:Transport protein [Teratosphaeria destructans]|uniref:Transport protein n=1 Tax=Teratosphaeria destructans TaxID=418781 RepID=A0A9W7T0W7_9PEZI|nr:Transport protein [Teratosphaeria destructans]